MSKFCFLIVAICLSLPTLCSIAVAESANPFGFETDRDPLLYGYCKKNMDFRSHGYICGSAPRPHPDLYTYALQFVKGIGLCRIEVSRQYTGLEVALVELLKQQIIYTYGQPIGPNKDSDEDMESAFQKDSSTSLFVKPITPKIWEEYKARLNSEIKEGQDNHHKEQKFYWKPGGGVQSIELTVSPLTDDVTFMHIYIKFTTFNACQQAIDEKGRNAFRHTDEIEGRR